MPTPGDTPPEPPPAAENSAAETPGADTPLTDAPPGDTPAASADRTPPRWASVASFLGLLVLVGLIAGAFVLASREPEPPNDYLSYLPDSDSPITAVSDPSDQSPPFTASTMVADIGTISLSLPGIEAATAVFGVLGSLGLEAGSTKAVRITWTSTNPDGSVSSYANVALLLPTGYQEILTVFANGSPIWYDPGVVQFPADLEVGSTWESEGITNSFAPYRFRGEVVEPSLPGDVPGCVDIDTRLDQEVPQGTPYSLERLTTWCPGKGATSSRNEIDGVTTRIVPPREVDWPSVTLPGLSPRPPGTVLAFPIPVAGVAFPPLPMSAGLVTTNNTVGDLVAVTVGEDDPANPAVSSQVLWMQHPGGQILGIAQDDERIYTTTSRRELLAFDRAGRLLWQRPLPDAAVGSPTTLGGVVAIALLDGSLRAFDAATGDDAWQARLSDVVTESPISTGDHLVVADSAGYVLAVDAQGDEEWTTSLDGVDSPLSPLADGSILLPQETGNLTLLDPDGSERWTVAPDDGSVYSRAQLWGDVVAVPTSTGLLGLDSTSGDALWKLEDLTDSVLAENGLVADRGRVLSVRPDGSASLVAEVTEVDGSLPAALYLERMGDQWVAMTTQGAITYLEVPVG